MWLEMRKDKDIAGYYHNLYNTLTYMSPKWTAGLCGDTLWFLLNDLGISVESKV